MRPSHTIFTAPDVLTLLSLDGLRMGEADAAEIDKELISARLEQNVLDHAGKLHLSLTRGRLCEYAQ